MAGSCSVKDLQKGRNNWAIPAVVEPSSIACRSGKANLPSLRSGGAAPPTPWCTCRRSGPSCASRAREIGQFVVARLFLRLGPFCGVQIRNKEAFVLPKQRGIRPRKFEMGSSSGNLAGAPCLSKLAPKIALSVSRDVSNAEA